MSSTGNSQTYDRLSYDVIVVGAGPAGENVADRAVQGGLSVAIVEDELAGGECSYWAYMPAAPPRAATGQASGDQQAPSAGTRPNVLSLGW